MPDLWREPLIEERYGSIEDRVVLTELVIEIVDVASPLLSKCSPTSSATAIQTPDMDAAADYLAARDAIVTAYASNFETLRFGVRADVKYPSGDVVRYVITGVSANPRDLSLRKFFDGIPKPGTSPC